MLQKSAGLLWRRLIFFKKCFIMNTNISLKVDRRKFEEMAELDKKRYVEEAVKRMEGWQN